MRICVHGSTQGTERGNNETEQRGRHFADDIFEYNSMTESASVYTEISLKFISMVLSIEN